VEIAAVKEDTLPLVSCDCACADASILLVVLVLHVVPFANSAVEKDSSKLSNGASCNSELCCVSSLHACDRGAATNAEC
jgi:hypothetical protein